MNDYLRYYVDQIIRKDFQGMLIQIIKDEHKILLIVLMAVYVLLNFKIVLLLNGIIKDSQKIIIIFFTKFDYYRDIKKQITDREEVEKIRKVEALSKVQTFIGIIAIIYFFLNIFSNIYNWF